MNSQARKFFEMTPSRLEMIHRYMESKYNLNHEEFEKMNGRRKEKKRYLVLRWKITTGIQDSIDRYGQDGFGDKPLEMDLVEYWISHLPRYEDF